MDEKAARGLGQRLTASQRLYAFIPTGPLAEPEGSVLSARPGSLAGVIDTIQRASKN